MMKSKKIAKFAQTLLLSMAIVGVVCGSSMTARATTVEEVETVVGDVVVEATVEAEAVETEEIAEMQDAAVGETTEEVSELEAVEVEEVLETTEAASGTWGCIIWTYENGVLTLTHNGSEYLYHMKKPDSAPSGFTSLAVCEMVAADYPWGTYRDFITKIVIGDDISSIGYAAFYNMPKLEEVVLGPDIYTIEYYAFGNCTSLKKVALPAKLGNFYRGVFYNCSSLEEVTGNVQVSSYAYYGCSSLKSIELPETTDEIYTYTFANCTSLKEIIIPEDVYNIGSYAFENCKSLTNIKTSESCSIRTYAFSGCTGLKEATVGDYVDNYAFKDCTSLTKVNLPTTEKCNLREGAFYNCTSLVEITGDMYQVWAETYYNCKSLKSCDSIIKDKQYIYDYAFYNCTGLTKVIYSGNSLGEIGDYAFANCGLKELWFKEDDSFSYGSNVLEGNPNCKVYGKLNSSANRLANANSCTFVPTDKIPQPTMSTLSSAVNGLRVSWDKTDYALTYDVYRSTLVGGNYTLLKKGVSSTAYIDTTATPGVKYYYKVIAVGELAKSELSEASVAGMYLKAPTFKKMVNVVSGVHVYWNAAQGAKTYSVYRSTSKTGDFTLVKSGLTATHYIDTTAASGKTYYYKVLAVNGSYSTSSYVEPFKAITFVGTPDITSRINKGAGVQLGWNKIVGATGYAIYRKPYEGGAWARVATISGNSTFTWTDTTVKGNNGTIYRYTVRALAGSDMKTLSGCRSTGRTMVRLSSRTLNSAVKASATSIKCNWTTSAAVTGYEVRFMVGSTVYRTFTVGNYKTGVKTFTGLPSGNTYKVQVRAYKKVDGVGSFYSAWSTEKYVKL